MFLRHHSVSVHPAGGGLCHTARVCDGAVRNRYFRAAIRHDLPCGNYPDHWWRQNGGTPGVQPYQLLYHNNQVPEAM
jgi:hypothetical protein